jgi:hypothetical protein
MVPLEETGFRNRPLPPFGAASRIQGRCFLVATEWHGRAELLAQNGKLACGMRGGRAGADPASIERMVRPTASRQIPTMRTPPKSITRSPMLNNPS